MREKKVNLQKVFPPGKCRFCHKKLKRGYRYFCPPPPPHAELTSCSERFATEYGGVVGDVYSELQEVIDETTLKAIDKAAYEAWANSPRPLHPLCQDCPETCKVVKPIEGTPTALICRKTSPELFKEAT
jgi:hypothetical protein